MLNVGVYKILKLSMNTPQRSIWAENLYGKYLEILIDMLKDLDIFAKALLIQGDASQIREMTISKEKFQKIMGGE